MYYLDIRSYLELLRAPRQSILNSISETVSTKTERLFDEKELPAIGSIAACVDLEKKL